MTSLAEIRGDDGKVPKFAWPGGYPIVYLADDGETVCADCVNDPSNPIHEDGEADGWRIDGYDIHWEGPPEHCAHCNAEILSAYGDPSEDDAS